MRGEVVLLESRSKPRGEFGMVWDFLQRYDESWIWRRADRHQVTESARNFAVLEECVADAIRHGYRAPNAKAKRSRLLASERLMRGA